MDCTSKDCTRKQYSRGLCQAHYMAAYRLRKSGGVTLNPALQMAIYVKFGSKTCSECSQPVHGKGLCGTHYARLVRARKKQNAIL